MLHIFFFFSNGTVTHCLGVWMAHSPCSGSTWGWWPWFSCVLRACPGGRGWLFWPDPPWACSALWIQVRLYSFAVSCLITGAVPCCQVAGSDSSSSSANLLLLRGSEFREQMPPCGSCSWKKGHSFLVEPSARERCLLWLSFILHTCPAHSPALHNHAIPWGNEP